MPALLGRWKIVPLSSQKSNYMRFFIHWVSREAGSISRMEKQSFLLEVWRKRTSLLWGRLNERLNWTAWSIFRSKWVGWDRNISPHISFGKGVCLERRSCEWARESRPESSRDPWAECHRASTGGCVREHAERSGWSQRKPSMCVWVWKCVWKCYQCVGIYVYECIWEWKILCTGVCENIWTYVTPRIWVYVCVCDYVWEGVSVCVCVRACVFVQSKARVETTSKGLLQTFAWGPRGFNLQPSLLTVLLCWRTFLLGSWVAVLSAETLVSALLEPFLCKLGKVT